MSRRFGQAAIFLVLLLMSLSLPLMIEAVFTGAGSGQRLPPETPVARPAAASESLEAERTRQNYAWLQGDAGSVLDAGDGVAQETAEAAEAVADGDAVVETPLDLRPGVFVGFRRSADSLDIRREQLSAGGFVFIASHTRLGLSGARTRFHDEVDRIYGRAMRFDAAHRLPEGWILEEGVEHDAYDGLHESWNGDARLSGAIAPRVGIAVEGGRRDVWERLATIRNKLRLWQVGLSLFYEIFERWWLGGFFNSGWLSDHNARIATGAEIGAMIAPGPGLSAAAGVENTTFREQDGAYWSPSYYHYVYGRIRLERDYERRPFEPRRELGGSLRDRLGYLAEVTAGVNDDGKPEVSGRAGLALRATDRLTLRAEGFHLDSAGRFDDNSYSENGVDASAEVRF